MLLVPAETRAAMECGLVLGLIAVLLPARSPAAAADHSPGLPPVQDMRPWNASVAFAAAYYCLTFQEGRERGWDVNLPEHQFSPPFLYSQLAPFNEGTTFEEVFTRLVDQGCATLATVPLADTNYTQWPAFEAFAEAIPFRLQSYTRLGSGWTKGTLARMRSGLESNELCIIGMPVLRPGTTNPGAFERLDATNCFYEMPAAEEVYLAGSLALAVVGYDDAAFGGAGGFKVVNAWGTGWGNAGFAWISYRFVTNFVSDVYVMENRRGYTPEGTARFRLHHDYWGYNYDNVTVTLGVGPPGVPLWSKVVLTGLEWGALTVDMAVDLTEGAAWLPPSDTNQWWIKIKDYCEETNGVLSRFEIQVANTVYSAAPSLPVTTSQWDSGSRDLPSYAFIPCGLVAASVYYVNDDSTNGDVYCTAPGDDRNDGLTPATPVRNIQEIIRRYTLQGDNVVKIDTGTYDLDSPVYLDQLDKGTTDHPVVFIGSRARNGTILRRASGAGDVLHLFNAEHVRFCNLWLVGGDNGIYFDGTEYTWLHGGDSDVRFCNVRVSQSAAAACRLQEGHGAVFENCLLQAEGHIALYAKGSDVWLQRCTVTTRNGDGLEGTSGLPEYISACTINLADSIVYADGGRCYFSGGFDVFSSTYSDFFATGGDLGLIPDSTSLNRYPRFVDLLGPDGVLGTADDDVHLQSIAGSWHGSSWSVDPGTSPCLDTGDPAADYSNEPMPNGGRIEMGFYANTTEASLTPSGRYLVLTSPISGCPADSPCPVGWLCQGTGWQPGDTVRVEYSSDGGLSWQLIAGSIAATNSPYSWDTRSFPGRVAFRVRVTSEQYPLASAVSDRPPPAVYIGDLSVLEGTGVTDLAVLPVWLSFTSATPVQVRYSTVDDSAFAGVDFLGTNGTLVFAPGTTNLTVAVAVLGNPYYETNRTFWVALSDATNASLVSTQGMVTIIDDDESPTTALPRALNTVGIDWQTSPYAAGWYLQTNVTHDGVAAAQSGRIWHSFNDDSVLEATVPGPARIGFWWKVSSGGHDPLVFSMNGVEQAGIPGEVDWEWREFLVPPGASNRLCWVFHMAFNYPGGGQNAAWVDEVTLNGPPLVNIGDVSVPEGTGEMNSAMLPVWLSCASRTPIELTYATVDGSAMAGLDYLGTNGVLVFNPGITNLTVAVAVLGDRYFEPNRTFGVALTGGSNVWILPTQGTVTIIDDDESPTTALPRALNTVGIDWQTSAYETGWYVETNVTHDGVAAAQSGIIRHPINDDSVLETTVPGPARIGFWWKVSSGGHDPLSFSINGVEQAGISGEVDWERREFLVPPGASNRLCWVFHTAFNYPGGGQNAAWVDEFTWDSLPLVSIGDLSVPEGTYVTSFARVPVRLSFASTSPAAVSFATMDGSAVAGVDYVGTNGVLVFEPGATNLTVPVAVLGNPYYETNRTFWVALTGATNAWLASTQALVTIVDDDESPTTALPRALNTVGLDWRTSPWQTGWCLVTNVTHDGVAAARSGSIRFGINNESVLETTVPGPSHISFWWKVSSRAYFHPLTFFINGVAQASISGEVDWEWRTFTVPPGASNQLRWVYSKDWSYNAAGQDAAWVDQFTVNALPLRLEAPEFRAGTFRFRLTSVAGCNYVLEFKDALGDDTWTAAGVWPGNDGVLEFTNMPPGTPQRFYRIQVQ